eukprot:4201796-Amphidinium_carterae.1
MSVTASATSTRLDDVKAASSSFNAVTSTSGSTYADALNTMGTHTNTYSFPGSEAQSVEGTCKK